MSQIDDKLRPVLYDPNNGIYAQQGKNAMEVNKTLDSALADAYKGYIDKVQDPKTRQMLEKLWLNKSNDMKDSVARYQLGQLGKYKQDTIQATISDSMTAGYNDFNDPDAIQKAIDRANQAIDVNSAGLPDQALASMKADAKSQIYLSSIARWASENPNEALHFFEEHKDDLSGKDIVTANSFVNAARDNQRAAENVARITSGNQPDLFMNGVVPTESGGDPTKISKAGALGASRILPETARYMAAKLGRNDIARLSDEQLREYLTDPAHAQDNLALGHAYFSEQIKRYNGDVEAALVAYNAGPKAADAFLRYNAGRDPGQRTYDVPGWKGLKNETEDYVHKVLNQVSVNRTPQSQRMTSDNWTLKNFKPEDIFAPTRGGQWVNSVAAESLDPLATNMKQRFPGFAIKINDPPNVNRFTTAGKRRGTADPADNPHVAHSEHLNGDAFDVQWQGWSNDQKAAFIEEARKLGFKGFGFYGPAGHIHIDMGRPRTWGTMPDFAKEAMNTPIGNVPGVQTTATAPLNSQQSQTVGPGAYNPNISGFFVNPNAGALQYWEAQAQLISDPGEREKTLAMLRVQAAGLDKQVAAEQGLVKQQAWDFVDRGGDPSKLPPELQSRLDPSFVNTLFSYEENRRKGAQPTTDPAALQSLYRMPDNELASVDLNTEYRNKLSQADFEKVLTMQREVLNKINGQQYNRAEVAGQRTQAEVLDTVAALNGWDLTTDDGKKIFAQFKDKMQQEIEATSAARDKPLTPQDIRDISDKLLIQDRYSGGFIDKIDPTAQPGQGYAAQATNPDAFVAASEWNQVQPDDQKTLVDQYQKIYGADKVPDQEYATDLYNRAFRVWLGGKPTARPEEDNALIEAYKRKYNGRAPTDAELDAYRRFYLLGFLGRSNP